MRCDFCLVSSTFASIASLGPLCFYQYFDGIGRFRMALSVQRRRNFHFAALLVRLSRGLRSGLLILELKVDQLLQVLPRYVAHQPAAIDKQCWRAVDAQFLSFRDRTRHFRFGRVRIHALLQLGRVPVLRFREIQYLALQSRRIFRDLVLVLVDPVVIIPERVGILPVNATARDGGCLRPGMNALQWKILEEKLDLRWECLYQVLPQSLRLHLTLRAFKIAELDDRNRRGGSAVSWSALRGQFLQIAVKRAPGNVVDITPQHVLAVFRDIDRLVLRRRSERKVNVDFLKIGNGRRLRLPNLHLHLGINHQQMPEIGFECGLIVSGFRSRRRKRRDTKHGQQGKAHKLHSSSEFLLDYITGPIRQGTNSLCPRRSLRVRSPEATRSTMSKISCPMPATVASPSAMRPAFTSMLSRIRLYMALLLAILTTGIVGNPIALPRPVVNAITLTPPAANPVSDTGSYPGVFMKTKPGVLTRSA